LRARAPAVRGEASAPLAQLSAEELAGAAQRGRRDCFDALAERMRPRLRGFLIARTGDPAEADDVAQEALLRAWARIGDYDPSWRFSTWLYTIAARLAITRRRAALRRAGHEAAVDEPPAADPVDAIAVRQGADRIWRRARDLLADREYRCLYLRYAEELSADEVAERLGLTTVHVRVLLHRARLKLVEEMSP
jgi:RNA polymerase sigma-70 factor (ECF subfamily)